MVVNLPSSHPALSNREYQILVLASRGKTDQAIANRLGISLATVGTYWGRIRVKLGPLNRTELVANFLKQSSEETLANLREENAKLVKELEKKQKHEREMYVAFETIRSLVSLAPDGIIVVDKAGVIRLANEAATDIFGYQESEFLNLHLSQLVPTRLREIHISHHESFFENPAKRRMGEHSATLAQHKDGSEFEISATLNAIETRGGPCAMCIIRKVETTTTTD